MNNKSMRPKIQTEYRIKLDGISSRFKFLDSKLPFVFDFFFFLVCIIWSKLFKTSATSFYECSAR